MTTAIHLGGPQGTHRPAAFGNLLDLPRLLPPISAVPSTDGDEALVREEVIWTTSIRAEPMDGGLSYCADIFEHGVFVCRIALSGRFESESVAEIELNRRLESWIAEYELRSKGRDAGELSSTSDSC